MTKMALTVDDNARYGNRNGLWDTETSESVTAQKTAERDKLAMMDRLETVLNVMSDGVTAVAFHGDRAELLFANKRYYEMHGIPTKTHVEGKFDDTVSLVHPDDREKLFSIIAEVSQTGRRAEVEYRIRNHDGSVKWIDAAINATRMAGIDVPVQVTIFKDVTEKKESRDRLLDNLPTGAALYEFDGKTVSAIHINKSYWELVNRSPVDYSSMSVFSAIHPNDRGIIRQEVEAAIRQGRNAEASCRILCGNGAYKPFHIVASITPKRHGRYLLYASYEPIDERSMSIQDMISVALSTMMSASPEIAYVKDKDLHYICCSQKTAEIAGLESARDLIGKSAYDVFEHEFAQRATEDDRRVIETGRSIVSYIEEIPSGNGGVRLSNTSKYPILDAVGNAVGVYCISHDVTEQKQKESQLELLTANIPGGLAAYSIAKEGFTPLYFNDGYFAYSGYTREEYVEMTAITPLALMLEEDRPRLLEMIRGFAANKKDGMTGSCLYRCRTKAGRIRWMSMKAVLREAGRERFVLNVVQLDVTEQQEEKERLRISEEVNRLAIEHSGKIVARFDVNSRTLTLPESLTPIFEVPHMLADLPEEQIKLGRISHETANAYRTMFNDIINGGACGAATYQHQSTIGWRWLEAQYTTVFSNAGQPISAVITFTDITEQLEKEVVYKKWQQSLANRPEDSYTLFRCNLSKSASFDSWEGKLLHVDFDNAQRNFSERTAEYVEQCVYAEDQERYLAFVNADTMLAEYYRGHRYDMLEYRESHANGVIRWLRLTVELVEYPNSKDVEVYLMFEDIDESKRAEIEIKEQAETDPLTGSLNRAAFISHMERIVSTMKTGESHAMLMLDVDDFKHINDSFGHAAGDQALKELTASIRTILRHGDMIGRLGGDEFLVFLKDIKDKDAAAAKAAQICGLDISVQGSDAAVTVSMGIAMSPNDGRTFNTLYKKADAALYRRKQLGKNGFLFAQKQDKTDLEET